MEDFVFHVEIYYSGRVQGVGFRYSTWLAAREFEVSGFVANLPDGRVLLEAEGQESEIVGFKKEIESRLKPFIRKIEGKTQQRPPQYSDFGMK